MRTRHLTEDEIQRLAAEGLRAGSWAAGHAARCRSCLDRVDRTLRLMRLIERSEPRCDLPPGFARTIRSAVVRAGVRRRIATAAAAMLLGAALGAGAAAIMPAGLLRSFLDLTRSAGGLIRTAVASLVGAGRWIGRGENAATFWILVSGLTLLFAAGLDVMLGRWRQILIDKTH
jgi:hypothetical protein